MKYRVNHCLFAVKNTNGKCIAPCHHNKAENDYDCIGRAGKTLNTQDMGEVPCPGARKSEDV